MNGLFETIVFIAFVEHIDVSDRGFSDGMTSSDQSAEVSCPRFFAWRARLLRSSRLTPRRCLRLHFLSFR